MKYPFLTFLVILVSILIAENVNVPLDDYPPFKIVNGSKVIGGIDIMLTDALLRETGDKAAYNVYPWARCLENMKQGHSDLISGITKKNDREEYMYFFNKPYKTKSIKAFFIIKDSKKKFTSLKDFENLTVGVLRGAKYFDEFSNNAKITKEAVDNVKQGLKMLAGGRFDAFIVNIETGKYELSKLNDIADKITIADYKYEGKTEVYFAISKKSALIKKIKEFESAQEAMLRNGEIDKILNTDFK